jgi:hypothetical protein
MQDPNLNPGLPESKHNRLYQLASGHSPFKWGVVVQGLRFRPNLSTFCQVRHLYDSGETKDIHLEMENMVNPRTTPKLTRNGEFHNGLTCLKEVSTHPSSVA